MDEMELVKRLNDPSFDPLPKEKQTGPWFEFADDMDIIDPANVPAPNDKVNLLLAWDTYQCVDEAMGEKSRKGQVRADKIAQRPANLSGEGLAITLNDM